MTPEADRKLTLYIRGLAFLASVLTPITGTYFTLLLWSQPPCCFFSWLPWPFELMLACGCLSLGLLVFIERKVRPLLDEYLEDGNDAFLP